MGCEVEGGAMIARQAGVAGAHAGGGMAMRRPVVMLVLARGQGGLEDLGVRSENLLQLVETLLELAPVAGTQTRLLSLLVFANGTIATAPAAGSWGINVLGSFFVEIEATDGTVGFATGFGGPPACWLVHQHFERFLIGADPRDTNLLFEQMYRSSMFYGRKGLPIAIISVIDLALWDLLGKLRNEPVYKLIGGATKDRMDFYCTGPNPPAAKAMGFWGAKVALPYCPDEGHIGLKKNVEYLRAMRESVGPDFPLMVDCYMSLNVSYIIELAKACEDININWWEECLSPDDTDGFEQIKRAHPTKKFTTGEHEYSRYGFRKLVEGRNLDIIQPDVMWL
ncbi:hypothetical protein BN1723_017246, partial [Verticillium longisporum]